MKTLDTTSGLVLCPNCGGRGTTTMPAITNNISVCRVCAGKGRLVQRTTVEYCQMSSDFEPAYLEARLSIEVFREPRIAKNCYDEPVEKEEAVAEKLKE